MSFPLTDIIVSVILGGFTGWITNSIAVNMLFRKYGKWGGVIEENYQAFIVNMSKLIEDDLVNGKTLAPEFRSPDFKQAVQKWVKDILQKELPRNSGNMPFEAIADIETSADRLATVLENTGSCLARRLFSEAGTLSVESVLSKKQYDHIIEEIAGAVTRDADKYPAAIRHILAAFLGGKNVSDFISDEAIQRAAENVVEIVRKINVPDFNAALDEACPLAAIDGLATELWRQLESTRLIDLLKNREDFEREQPERVAGFVRSEKGQEILGEAAERLLSAASRLDIKLSDLAGHSVKKGIVKFCNEKIPGIIYAIAGFVRDTRSEIEEIVNNAVDSQLEKTNGGMGGKFLKDIFIGNLAGRINVVEKIAAELEKFGENAGRDASERIIAFMETKTAGELVIVMRDAGILTPKSVTELARSKTQELSDAVSKLILEFLSRPASACLGDTGLSTLKTKLLAQIYNGIKTEYLFTDRFKDDICLVIAEKITGLSGKNAADLLNEADINITFNKERVKNSLSDFWKTFSGMKISDIAGEIPPESMRITKDAFLRIWNRNKGRKLGRIYNAVRKDSVHAQISEWMFGVINENADAVLTGTISTAVEAELNKLRPKEINSLARDFMGKEMKAINILGAVLGAVAGLIPALAERILNVSYGLTWQMPVLYGIVFAFVGIGTNWLAIRMLFRPYKPLFERAKFPPFTGVVAAHKPRFAKTTATFIKNKMLAEQALQQRFTDNKAAIKEALRKSASDSDYAVIDSVFEEERRLDSVSAAAFSGIQKYILERRRETAAMLAGKIKQLVASHELYRLVPKLQDALTCKLRTGGAASAVYGIVNDKIRGKSLESLLTAAGFFSDSRLEKLSKNILRDLAENITPDRIQRLIDSRNDGFVSYIETHSLEDFAGTPAVNGFLSKIDGRMDPVLRNAARAFVRHLEKYLDPAIKLRDLSNGIIPYMLEKNAARIIDALCGEIRKSRGAIVREIEDSLPFYALPWRGQVRPIVDTLIDIELPAFFNRNRRRLFAIADTQLDNTLADIGFDDNPLESAAVDHAAESLARRASKDAARLAGDALRLFARMPLKRLFGCVNITRLGDIATEPLLPVAVSCLKNSLSREETSRVAASLIKKILPDILKSVPSADIIKNIDIETEIGSLISRILDDRNALNAIYEVTDGIFSAMVNGDSFYDEAVLQDDLSGFIARFAQDCRLKSAVTPYFNEFFAKLNGAFTNETKDCICGYLAGATVDACAYNFSHIFESVNIASVVEREINNMHPKEIETLFYRFAGGYFAKIIFYGWIGLFGGALGYFIGYCIKRIL
ncbi:MAG: DUF445 family protein [Spirochaetaceae bacterium]|jgi:uncharacterized membrane protein YheB (UPF0754 family)|nr:DUF445 family protein [Spirochaetaceae bacterium]